MQHGDNQIGGHSIRECVVGKPVQARVLELTHVELALTDAVFDDVGQHHLVETLGSAVPLDQIIVDSRAASPTLAALAGGG